MERTAERRKKRSKGCISGGNNDNSPGQGNEYTRGISENEQGGEEGEDTFTKLARKIRNVQQHLLVCSGRPRKREETRY